MDNKVKSTEVYDDDINNFEFGFINNSYYIKRYTGSSIRVAIPENYNGEPVRQIEMSAFKDKSSIEKIKIPDGITLIGSFAFSGCTSLRSITIPAGVVKIGGAAFSGCTSLTNITIPVGVMEIGRDTFSGCTSLTSITIPDSVRKIGWSAFSNCTSLASIIIPDRVKEIGESAFSGCTSLGNITIPDSVREVGASTFSGCTSLTSITIPDKIREIGGSAFSDCTSLTSIIIPDSVFKIGGFAFRGCPNLTIYCEAEAKPDSWHSDWNSSFRLVVWGYKKAIPNESEEIAEEKVDYIEEIIEDFEFYRISDGYAIKKYTGSSSEVRIPKRYCGLPVLEIWGDAFLNNEKIKVIILHDMIRRISASAFDNCENIEYNEFDNAFYLGDDINPYYALIYVDYEKTSIHSNTRIITDAAFYDSEIESITIPSSVKYIGNEAFCRSKCLKNVVISSGVEIIGSEAFAYCYSLESMTIPESVTAIYSDAFKELKLKNFSISDGLTRLDSLPLLTCLNINKYDNAYYLATENNPYYVLVMASDKRIKSCEINIQTRFIYSGAFSECVKLKNIIIPEGVIEIGEYAFRGCTSLTSITIPDSVKIISYSAFSDCIRLKNIVIPNSVREIGPSAFSDCKSLKSITIPDSVQEIGWFAFSECKSLKSIILPNSLWEIDSSAFSFCKKLTIYCEAEGKPEGWDVDWNSSNCPVVWGYKG